MLDTFKKLYQLLDTRERRKALLLFCMICVAGIMEATGVASIMPFLAVISNPETIQTNTYLSFAYQLLGFSSQHSFLIFLGFVVFITVLVALSFKAFTQYAIFRFTHMRNYSLSTRMLRHYLCRPYSWFLDRHSSDLGKTVLSEVQQVITKTLVPSAQFLANIVVAVCLIALLLLVNPWIALFAAVFLGGAYVAIYSVLRKYLSRIGADRVRANQERFQIAQEALGGIKEVKAAGLESGYLSSFAGPALRFSRRQAANNIIAQVPRFVLQALAFGGLVLLVLILLAIQGGDLGHILPTLGVFAFAGQRLLPALQEIYKNATDLRFGKPALDALYADLMDSDVETKTLGRLKKEYQAAPLGLRQRLDLENVDFFYPGTSKPALSDLNLSIPANNTVGFVGSTGAGKTTAVDVILGLLTPTRGQVKVDQTPIASHNLSAWQRSIGYVPQYIFLADDTVAANIAFGVPKDELDMQAAEQAGRIAELHEFVMQELSHGYQTLVGERGVRLSGGQRQRIGIARALYHDPDVLILDEATAALDNLTEKAVMEAVHNLSRQKTIILIAHRLSTVQKCDQIFLLEHGKLAAQGNYTELLEVSQEFRDMAAVNE